MLTLQEIAEMIGEFEGTEEARKDLEEHGRISEGAQARIAELEEKIADLEAKYTATAARNYELMSAATAPVPEDGENEAVEEVEEDDGDADVTELFVERD